MGILLTPARLAPVVIYTVVHKPCGNGLLKIHLVLGQIVRGMEDIYSLPASFADVCGGQWRMPDRSLLLFQILIGDIPLTVRTPWRFQEASATSSALLRMGMYTK